MIAPTLLSDALDRVIESTDDVVDGLDSEQLTYRPLDRGNSIAWLVWHMARVADDHIGAMAEREQRWTVNGWMSRFNLRLPSTDTGFGHGHREVSKVVAPGPLLLGYLTDVTTATQDYLRTLKAPDYERVVDTAWDPPVTLGVRIVSVVNDMTQHVGQAAYVKGLLDVV
ncbi:MAG TPA: DinB family protein [Candidatus Stackebrandtia excrementipullorum]|nr:DinB family protein [Candidatus Stackebrandtia excrementipullorum]